MSENNIPSHEKYRFKPFPGSSHSWALDYLSKLPKETKILDFGAGSGAIGASLLELNFSGLNAIELDPVSREHIKGFYNETACELDDLKQKEYEVIIILDVLEHIINPELLLTKLSERLTSGGKILISLPNIAHWSVRIPLLFGSFNYKSRGILDRTHVNFYTRKSAAAFIKSISGLKIIKKDASIEPLELLLPEAIYKNPLFQSLSTIRMKIAAALPGFFAYQNLFLVEKT